MISEDNKKILSNILTESVPTLFLGAGFSIGLKGTNDTMDGTKLNDYIYNNYILPKKADAGLSDNDLTEIKNNDLKSMCDSLYSVYGPDEGKKALTKILVDCYSNIFPGDNKFHLKLTNYPWRNILYCQHR